MTFATVTFFVTLPFTLYAFYLIYCTLHVVRENGKLDQAPIYIRGYAYVALLIAYTLDVIFNITFGSVLFLELPAMSRLTFTARCARWRRLDPAGLTRRGRIARWVCESWLNIYEDHC